MFVKLTGGISRGVPVHAKLWRGTPCAVTYVNRTQAEKAAAKLGGQVIQPGRVFYVAMPEANHA